MTEFVETRDSSAASISSACSCRLPGLWDCQQTTDTLNALKYSLASHLVAATATWHL
jgi:hypothetical protein